MFFFINVSFSFVFFFFLQETINGMYVFCITFLIYNFPKSIKKKRKKEKTNFIGYLYLYYRILGYKKGYLLPFLIYRLDIVD